MKPHFAKKNSMRDFCPLKGFIKITNKTLSRKTKKPAMCDCSLNSSIIFKPNNLVVNNVSISICVFLVTK